MKKTAAFIFTLIAVTAILPVFPADAVDAGIFDAANETGISEWSAVPFVTEQNLADGYTGGEGCQHMNSVSRDTVDGELLFVGTDVGGVFRSKDGGDTWEPCNRGFNTRGVCRVAIDPMNKNHVIAVNCAGSVLKYNALYYSFDMGDNWTRCRNTNLGYRGGYYYYNMLRFDASSYNMELGYCTDVYWSTPYERDGNLITADAAGLYRSQDGGVTFEKSESEQPLFDGILLTDGGLVKLANQYGIFAQSEKNGAFEKRSDISVQSFLFVNNVYYILAEDGIYTSPDLTSFTKTESTNFPAGRDARNLEVSAVDSSHMVLSARKSSIKYSERPFYSYDGGKTWALGDISDKSGLFYYYTYHSNVFSFHPKNPGEVVATQGGVVIKSLDWGKTWKSSNTGINNVMCGGKFNFNIYDSNLIYVGAQDFGGALTTDGGKTWLPISLSKDNDGKNIYGGYAVDQTTFFGVYTEQWGNSTLRANQRYVCYTHDGGNTVNITKTQLGADAEQFESIRISEKIAASRESSYQSPNNKDILFCANYRSTDRGHTWVNMLSSQNETRCLQVYAHYGTTLYGAYDGAGYIVKSDDDGASWTKVNTEAFAGKDYHVSDIAVDGKNGFIYAAFSDKLYRMDMNGENITDLTNRMIKDNMGVRRIITVAVDPIHPEVVYCGGSGDYYQSVCGVRRSCDSGETWYTVSCSNAQDCIVKSGRTYGLEPKCLRVDPSTGELWSGTSCLGFSKLSPPYKTCALNPDDHEPVTDAAVTATCTHTGLTEGSHCALCGKVLTAQQTVPLLAHSDSDGDGFCDACGRDMNGNAGCSHMCHQSGIQGLLWKIINFFNRLFRINQYCTCGERHW